MVVFVKYDFCFVFFNHVICFELLEVLYIQGVSKNLTSFDM